MRSAQCAALIAPDKGCSITSSAGEQLEDLETTALTRGRALFHAIDGDDIEFRVFLAELERRLEFGRVAPAF
jgi:hypothetical protein